MIKGCHKSIIFLKNTGSELFDEAYFVVKPSASSLHNSDIVYEASRIAGGLDSEERYPKRKRGLFISFLLGTFFGGLGSCLFLLILF